MHVIPTVSTKYFSKNNLDLETTILHSIHALISLVDSIKNHLDNDYFLCGIFIDIQQAFDTINHDILLAKLAHYRKVDWLIAGRVPF